LFLLGGFFALLTTTFVTRFWKISMHMTGIGGLCGSIVLCAIVWPVDLRLLLALLFVLSGAVGSARLIVNAHTPAQVTAGFFAGFLPQLGILVYV
jgi:membrane-associated phospholipid phosphatase